jgi:hypothetical protein
MTATIGGRLNFRSFRIDGTNRQVSQNADGTINSEALTFSGSQAEQPVLILFHFVNGAVATGTNYRLQLQRRNDTNTAWETILDTGARELEETAAGAMSTMAVEFIPGLFGPGPLAGQPRQYRTVLTRSGGTSASVTVTGIILATEREQGWNARGGRWLYTPGG